MKAPKFCDIVPHSPMDPERLVEVEAAVGAAGRLTEKYHSKCSKVSKMDFFVEFVREFREGEDVEIRGVLISSEDAGVMMEAKELEGDLLASFSHMITNITRKVAKKHHVSEDDLFGAAYKSFLNTMIHYNGETRFSTFLYYYMYSNLVKSCERGGSIRIPAQIRKLTMRVVGRMQCDRASFDDAVGSEGLSREKVMLVVAAMSKVKTASELDIRESDMVGCEDSRVPSGVMEALSTVKLGNLEKAALKGFLESPSGIMGLSKGCSGMINPNTGRPYSRAAISSAWRQAKKKIAVALKNVA